MVGQSVQVHTLEYLESQGQGASFVPRVMGFASRPEREFFELLTSVKGLGPKRGLRVMAVEPGVIARAIAERNARLLQTLPEIGPKLAESIVHELKSRCDSYIGLGVSRGVAAQEPASAAAAAEVKPARRQGRTTASRNGAEPRPAPHAAPAAPIRAAVDALVALGESPVDAERMVARAMDRWRSAGDDAPVDLSVLITAAYAAR